MSDAGALVGLGIGGVVVGFALAAGDWSESPAQRRGDTVETLDQGGPVIPEWEASTAAAAGRTVAVRGDLHDAWVEVASEDAVEHGRCLRNEAIGRGCSNPDCPGKRRNQTEKWGGEAA